MSVQFVPLPEKAFPDWLNRSIKTYAEDNVRAERWEPHEALEKSRQQFRELLPDGLSTENHHIFQIESENKVIGYLWIGFHVFNLPSHKAWLFDICIEEHAQRRGFGLMTMQALEAFCKKHEINEIGLNVFGYNQRAFALYEKLGYKVVSKQMKKTINP